LGEGVLDIGQALYPFSILETGVMEEPWGVSALRDTYRKLARKPLAVVRG
jgi:hypothetical protein